MPSDPAPTCNGPRMNFKTPEQVSCEQMKPNFGTHPPWLPATTKTAAAIVGVHPKTLLRWAREADGPLPIDRDQFLFNQLFWTPGRLVEWQELREDRRDPWLPADMPGLG